MRSRSFGISDSLIGEWPSGGPCFNLPWSPPIINLTLKKTTHAPVHFVYVLIYLFSILATVSLCTSCQTVSISIFLVTSMLYVFYVCLVFCAVSQLIRLNCSNKLLDFRQLQALTSSLVCLVHCIYLICF